MPQLPLKVKPTWFTSFQQGRGGPTTSGGGGGSGRTTPDPDPSSPQCSAHSRPANPGAIQPKKPSSQPNIRGIANSNGHSSPAQSRPNNGHGRVSASTPPHPQQRPAYNGDHADHHRPATGYGKIPPNIQPSPPQLHRMTSPTAMEVDRCSGTSPRDVNTMPRAVKVQDNVRSIIPSHKGLELTYDQRVLGSFGIDIREKIGEGVYAKVRLGVDLFSGKPEELSKFAIKIIDKEKVTSRFIENFLDRELAVWSKLSHVGITQFYYYTVTPRKVYMVLEYLSGGDLLAYVQNLKTLPEKQEVTHWAWQLISAIEYIHSLGAAHRDIKLENILMEAGTNRLKLTDFGFSTDDASRLSTTFCGSKAYAAPELIRAVPYSPQAVDIWAMGCVFFVFVNGIMAFDETVEQSVLLYNQRNRVYVWRNPRNHSPTAKRVIENMLTCDWKLRPTAAQLLNDAWIRNGAVQFRSVPAGTTSNVVNRLI